MEVHEIRYFLALCETLNFTRAADLCHVSQPALTRAIKGLEGKLGGTLIHRERGNTHLTDLGRIMQPYFRDMLDRMDEARRLARSHAQLKTSKLRVGMMCTIGPHRLVDLFSEFTRQHSGVELYLRDAAAAEIEDEMLRGDLDLAIYCRPESEHEGLYRVPLYSERLIIAVSPGHPLARQNSVRLADLNGHTYLCRANCEYKGYLDRVSSALGIEVKTVYRSEREDWIQSMVLAGIGFTFLPEFSVLLPGIVMRTLIEPDITRQISLATVRGRPHSPAVGAFVQACRHYRWSEKLRLAPTVSGEIAA